MPAASTGPPHGSRPDATSRGTAARHGLGYTVIWSIYGGIEAETRFFVPLGATLEAWQLTLANRRRKAADVRVFAGVEFCLWDAADDATNYQRNFSTGEVEVPAPGDTHPVIYHKTEYRERRDHVAYFACSEAVAGFDTQREAFLSPYRGWDAPLAVERGSCSGSVAHGWAPVAIFEVAVHLEPGESRRIGFALGYHENPRDRKFDPPGSTTVDKRTVLPVIARFTEAAAVDAAFEDLTKYWHGLLSMLQVATPEVHADRMVNIWNAYQCMITFNLSRSASYFESGIGRGLGFRDSSQDLLGFVHLAPGRARRRILDLAATQLPTGGAYHQYQPLTRRGNNDIGSNFNDDPLWLVLAVSAYLRETGDAAVLDESVPWDNQPAVRDPARRPPRTLPRLHPGTARSARAAADRPGGLERLPQSQLLLRRARAVVPDHREPGGQGRGVGVHRRTVRARRGRACRHPPVARARRRADRAHAERAGWKRPCAPTGGMARGSCARTTTRAGRSVHANATRDASSSKPRASA